MNGDESKKTGKDYVKMFMDDNRLEYGDVITALDIDGNPLMDIALLNNMVMHVKVHYAEQADHAEALLDAMSQSDSFMLGMLYGDCHWRRSDCENLVRRWNRDLETLDTQCAEQLKNRDEDIDRKP